MNTSEFDFYLPEGHIATTPLTPRDNAKMLVLDRKEQAVIDSYFFDLLEFVREGDVLVMNDSKVIPARLHGKFNGRIFEVLLVKNLNDSQWECWVRPGKKAKIGGEFVFGDNLTAKLVERKEEIFIFEFSLVGEKLYEELGKIGEMPVPPYILRERRERGVRVKNCDKEDYQTVYAEKTGSVAAPTAGLHFSDELISRLKEKKVNIEKVTLHVGLGTFQPINTEQIEDFNIHSEYYEVSEDVAKRLNKAKKEGRRIIAVGTTSVRVLESAAVNGILKKLTGETRIYIYPGYQFQFVDGIITNFHLPKSSLLLLVSAFAGKDFIFRSYDYAIKNNYRFYSYGDGMLIL